MSNEQPYINEAGVLVIPKDQKYVFREDDDKPKLVAPYCRVSTPQESQEGSLEYQKSYYEEYINKHKNWTLVDIYADPGISGTNTRHRKEFLRLINDCKAGKVNFIITKAVSRFARNAVDSINYCRMLKSLNPPVGVFFETENLNTLATDSEVLLTLLSVFAQEESRSKSTSVSWGFKRRFEDGQPMIIQPYGFDKYGRTLVANDDIVIVQLMYQWAAQGVAVGEIVNRLNAMRIRSPKGCDHWSYSTVMYILTNEKYCGDVIMQKTVMVDLFEHKRAKNIGQEPQYYKQNYHEPAVPKEDWDLVQAILGTSRMEKILVPESKHDIGPWQGMSTLQWPELKKENLTCCDSNM